MKESFDINEHFVPLFRAFPYFDPSKQDVFAGGLMNFIEQNQKLSEDLKEIENADVWLWPTLTAAQLHACASIKVRSPIAGCVHTPVTSLQHPNGEIWWRHAFIAAQTAGLRTNIGAIEPEHKYEYVPLTVDRRFNTFPVYFEGISPKAPRSNLITIGFFGQQQRPEKGNHLLMEVVNRILRLGFKVILQDSEGKITGEREGLTTIGFVPDLAAEIAKCDLIVLPYDPKRYKNRGSGILMDAIASGIPSVVPFGTAAGRWIDRTGSGTQFVEQNVSEIVMAVEVAHANYGIISEAAYQAAKIWRDRHGMHKFANSMIYSESFGSRIR